MTWVKPNHLLVEDLYYQLREAMANMIANHADDDRYVSWFEVWEDLIVARDNILEAHGWYDVRW